MSEEGKWICLLHVDNEARDFIGNNGLIATQPFAIPKYLSKFFLYLLLILLKRTADPRLFSNCA